MCVCVVLKLREKEGQQRHAAAAAVLNTTSPTCAVRLDLTEARRQQTAINSHIFHQEEICMYVHVRWIELNGTGLKRTACN